MAQIDYEKLKREIEQLKTNTPTDIITDRRLDPMENNNVPPVPYMAFESSLARMDRINRRMVAVIIILIILFVASNAYWIYEWNSYDYVDDYSIEIDSDDGSNANYLNGDGDINNGGKG